jgi:hypothetical protein
MKAIMYTRERRHIGSIWSRVTCLALLLAAAQSLLLIVFNLFEQLNV